MKMKTLLASLALASLVAAQPASAATRSSDSLPRTGVQATATADRAGSLSSDSEELVGTSAIWIIVLIAALLGVLVAASSGSKSPG